MCSTSPQGTRLQAQRPLCRLNLSEKHFSIRIYANAHADVYSMGMSKMQLRHELILILSESPGTDLVFQDPIIAVSVEEVTLGQREPLGIIMSCFLLQHLGPVYFSFSHRGSPPAKQKNLLVGVRFSSPCHASEIDAVASLKRHEKPSSVPIMIYKPWRSP